MSDDLKKQLIADAFRQGKLFTVNGKLIRCDYITPLIAASFIFIGYVLPLPWFIISFGQAIIRNPAVLRQFYQRMLELDWSTSVLATALMLFAITLLVWLFVQGAPQVQLAIEGFKEYWRERKTQQYHYGLLLTENHFALRCFTPSYRYKPLILNRSEIENFYLCSEYSEASHSRNQFIMMEVVRIDGSTERLRLPSPHLDCRIHNLHSQLATWLNR